MCISRLTPDSQDFEVCSILSNELPQCESIRTPRCAIILEHILSMHVVVLILYSTACPRGHPYFVGEVRKSL